MKIALCLSGQPRGVPFCVSHLIDNIIIPNNITDVFCHTWYHTDCIGRPFDSAQPHQEDGRLGKWKIDTDKIIIDKLKPKKFLFEAPNEFAEYQSLVSIPGCTQNKLVSLFYGIWKANELKREYEIENNIKYDIVIRTRFDLYYSHGILINEYITENNKNTIFVSDKFQNQRESMKFPMSSGGEYLSMVDTFAFGTSENMDKYSSVYPKMKEINSEIKLNPGAENYLGYQVKNVYKIPLTLIPIEYDILHRVMNLNKI